MSKQTNIGSNTQPNRRANEQGENALQGYPLYPASEDIYNKLQKDINVDPEDVSKVKRSNDRDQVGMSNEKDFDDDISGDDLDIPGSELDDAQEDIGSEDEENNYYSIGGDAHNDLEENN